MFVRREGGENGSEGRCREGGRCITSAEFHPIQGKSIDIRTGIPGITITAQMVCPQGIDGDDDDIVRAQIAGNKED